MKYLFFLLLLMISRLISAQSVTGTLKDKNGNVVEYANVFVQKCNLHTHSDNEGKYFLPNVHIGDSILISHISYEPNIIVLNPDHFQSDIKSILIEKRIDLNQVIIRPDKPMLSTMSKIDVLTYPVSNSQEFLRRVPGLIIGQHAGGGKAEQIFLRGFDLDHGTDINISIDGLPVNMVSHAHGQGYADLHFIIPEIIDQINYGKGPYDTDKGNLATAGYVSFKTKDSPENSFFTSEYGSFNTRRLAGLMNLISSPSESAYVATEYNLSDGPFTSSQEFNRLNIFAKYTKHMKNNDKLSIWGSRFFSRWNASGQVPERAVTNGSIGRFGSVDDTEGGKTSRANIVLNYTKCMSDDHIIKTRAFFTAYDYLLFSNFTFFLIDTINGDQIRQSEKRNIYGFDTELNFKITDNHNYNILFKAGTGLRYDDVNNVELSHTLNRKNTLQRLALGQVDETNLFGHAHISLTKGNVMVNTGLRVDYFKFNYENNLSTLYGLNYKNKSVISPKLTIQYTLNRSSQLFAKFGKGFHSNDSRVVTENQSQQILPSAYGFDLGGIFKPHKNLIINAAVWYLYLDQEFVYVGDAGIVEPGGRTRRQGVDFGLRFQPIHWLFIYSDLNIANPRMVNDAEGFNYIPLAPLLTNTGGFSFNPTKSMSGGLRYRYIADRPANVDNSIIAKGYNVIDFNINYSLSNITIGLEINNVLNTDWNETQFATESRLKNEFTSVNEIHFTPGAPLSLKGKVKYIF